MSSPTRRRRLGWVSFGSAMSMLLLAPEEVAGTSSQEGDPPTLTARVSPAVIAPDGELTYSSVDPCPSPEQDVRVGIAYGPDGWSTTEGGIQFYQDTVEVGEDGSWSATVPGPEGVVPESVDPEGRFELVAECRVGEETEPPDPPAEVIAQYNAIDFDAAADTPTPSTTSTTSPTSTTDPDAGGSGAVPRAQPARPVPGQPNNVG